MPCKFILSSDRFAKLTLAGTTQSLEPPLLQFEMDLDIRLGNGKIMLYPNAKSADDSFTRKSRFNRFGEQVNILRK